MTTPPYNVITPEQSADLNPVMDKGGPMLTEMLMHTYLLGRRHQAELTTPPPKPDEGTVWTLRKLLARGVGRRG